ncbi:MAG: hypothetical protein AABZ00_00910 [Chloroflexota bacterium]
MLKLRKLTYVLIFVAIILFLTPSHALACSGITPPFWDAYTSATAVFTGKIISIETSSHGTVKVTFQVFKSWKGPNNNYLVVTTSGNPASCGFPFTELKADTFLVYAYGDDELSTHTFSRTAPFSVAGADILKLNIITNLVPIVLVSIAIGLIIRGIFRYLLHKRRMTQ